MVVSFREQGGKSRWRRERLAQRGRARGDVAVSRKLARMRSVDHKVWLLIVSA